MSATAVICCPRCGRQYEVGPDMAGRACQCRGCKSTFTVNLARLTVEEPTLTLIDPVAPHFNFMWEACGAVVRNAADLLGLEGEPVTPANLYRFVHSMPRLPRDLRDTPWRDAYCNSSMRKAYLRLVTDDDRRRYGLLADYFLHQIPSCDLDALALIDAAFAGILSIEFDRMPGKELAVYRKPGPLERWAARRGL